MHDDATRSGRPAQPTPPAADHDAWLSRVIDERYRIVERLGEGGMGAVFVAEHLHLRKRVALKVIHSHFAGNDEIAARFAREAMTSARIEHPNVASALDFGSLPEGGAYLVMQLVRGPSLSEHLAQSGALAWPEACQIAAQIADAVAAAHASGIVHRDLKPDNVILMPNDQGPATVKVLDFGIAHVKSEQAPHKTKHGLTRAGAVMGTPGYMPPEQATGQNIDERADLYALGVILWELLTGHAPFDGESFSQIVTRQLSAPAPALNLSPQREIPEALRTLVSALLERSPADRPRAASDVRDRLLSFTSDALTRAPSLGPPAASLRPSSQARSSLAPGPQPWSAKPFRVAALALALLAALTVVRWALLDAAPPAERAAPAATQAAPSVPPKPTAEERAPVDAPSADAPASTSAPATEQAAPAKKVRSRSRSDRPRPVQRLRRALDELLQ